MGTGHPEGSTKPTNPGQPDSKARLLILLLFYELLGICHIRVHQAGAHHPEDRWP